MKTEPGMQTAVKKHLFEMLKLFFTLLLLCNTAIAQKQTPLYFAFTLTDTLFHSEKNRPSYTYRYNKRKKELGIYTTSERIYTIKVAGAAINEMLITYSGRILIIWQPLSAENKLAIRIKKNKAFPNPGTMNFTVTHAGAADYCEIPFWHSTNILWDLSYAGGKPHSYKLVTPLKFIESKYYRDFTCLFNKSCGPEWEKILPPVSDSAKPLVLIDSSVFLLRQQQINQQLFQVADSMMQAHFGEEVFQRYFKRVCFQKKYTLYPDGSYTVNNNAPCIPAPDTLCRNADITYRYFSVGGTVPLEIKLSVFIENGGYGIFSSGGVVPYKKMPVEQFNLLTTEAVKEHIRRQFPAKEFLLPSDIPNSHMSALLYAPGIPFPDTVNIQHKRFGPSYTIMETTEAGNKWGGGYMYVGYIKNPLPEEERMTWYFDAVTGAFLFSSKVTNFLEEAVNKP